MINKTVKIEIGDRDYTRVMKLLVNENCIDSGRICICSDDLRLTTLVEFQCSLFKVKRLKKIVNIIKELGYEIKMGA